MAQKRCFTNDVTHKNPQPTTKKIFFHCRLEDCRIFWGFEQLSNAIGKEAMALVMQPKTAGFRLIARYEYIVHWLSRC